MTTDGTGKVFTVENFLKMWEDIRQRPGLIAKNDMGEIPWTPRELRILETEGWTYCAACHTMHPPHTPLASEEL